MDEVVYHGRPSLSPYFHRRFTGQGNDQEGPGFYFTPEWEDAWRYTAGTGCVITAKLAVREWVPTHLDCLPRKAFEFMWGNSPDDARMDLIEDWCGEATRARDALRDIVGIGQQLQQIWYDLYKPRNSDAFLRNLSAFYQGIEIRKNDYVHYCIFDPDVIEVQEIRTERYRWVATDAMNVIDETPPPPAGG